MLAASFLYTGAVIGLWLIIFTLIAYAAPDSTLGKVFALIK